MKRNINNNKISRYGFWAVFIALVAVFTVSSCRDYPVDKDGLLITERTECYVSSFSLLGIDMQSVTIGNPSVDTVGCVINALVHFGTDLKNLYPRFSLVTDALLEPKITGYVDFSSLSRQWTVISGNRGVRKTYTVNITVQKP